MKKYLPFTILAVIFLFGCAPLRPYIGKSYPATNSVDIYYGAHDVKKDYEIIGKTSNDGTNLDKMQNEIVQDAKKRGADGVIYSDIKYTGGRRATLTADFIKYK